MIRFNEWNYIIHFLFCQMFFLRFSFEVIRI